MRIWVHHNLIGKKVLAMHMLKTMADVRLVMLLRMVDTPRSLNI